MAEAFSRHGRNASARSHPSRRLNKVASAHNAHVPGPSPGQVPQRSEDCPSPERRSRRHAIACGRQQGGRQQLEGWGPIVPREFRSAARTV